MAWLWNRSHGLSSLYSRALAQVVLPQVPIVVIGHWRSGTTYLHQLLACDPTIATARNALTVVLQVALLLKPWLRTLMQRWMTSQRPIDVVPRGPDDPQEDELGLARLKMDTNMAFPPAYPFHFGRSVLATSRAFEHQWLHFNKLTWLHEAPGKTELLIKNSANMARFHFILRHFHRARFVLLPGEPIESIHSLVQISSD